MSENIDGQKSNLNIDTDLNLDTDADYIDKIATENAVKEEMIEEAVEEVSDTCEEELAKAKEDLVRAQADFENIKKRMEKDKVTAVSFANEAFARDLLPVIDALEMAAKVEIDSGDSVEAKLKEGINLTMEEFKRCLAKHGITVIEAVIGGEFDPELHNAINYMETAEVESGKIAQIYQTGYRYNDRVLRPSMVVIAK